MEYSKCASCKHLTSTDPLVLPCLHAYCQKCAGALRRYRHAYTCALCEPAESANAGSEICMMCEASLYQDAHARQASHLSYTCQDCEDRYLCSDCVTLHTRFPSMRDHRICPAKRFRLSNVGHPLAVCTRHDVLLTHACMPCRALICDRCLPDHRDHRTLTVQDAEHAVNATLTARMNRLTDTHNVLKKDALMAEQLRDEYRRQLEEHRRTAQAVKDALIEKITQDLERFEYEINQAKSQVDKVYQVFIHGNNEIISQIRNLEGQTRTLKTHPDAIHLLQTVWHTLDREFYTLDGVITDAKGSIPHQFDLQYQPSSVGAYDDSLVGTLCVSSATHPCTYVPSRPFTHNPRVCETLQEHELSSIRHVATVNLAPGCIPGRLTALDHTVLLPNTSDPHLYRIYSESMDVVQSPTTVGIVHAIEYLTPTDLIASTDAGLYILDAHTLHTKEKLLHGRYGKGLWVNCGEVTALRVGSNTLDQVRLHAGSHFKNYRRYSLDHVPNFSADDSVISSGGDIYIALHHEGTLYKYNTVNSLLTEHRSTNYCYSDRANTPLTTVLCGIDGCGNLLTATAKGLHKVTPDGQLIDIPMSQDFTDINVCGSRVWAVRRIHTSQYVVTKLQLL